MAYGVFPEHFVMKIEQGMCSPGEQVFAEMERHKITVWQTSIGPDYVVSDEGGWLPGVFDSRASALVFASMLTPEQQEKIGAVCENGTTIISMNDLTDAINERLSS